MKLVSAILVCAAGLLGGCGDGDFSKGGGGVERTMVITSEPPGAVVMVSAIEVGRTPVTMPFLWYGDYDIVLRLDGYQTLKTHADLKMPWYEVPPLDLFSDTSPWTTRDTRYLHFQLRKSEPLTDAALLERAEKLKQQNLQPVEK